MLSGMWEQFFLGVSNSVGAKRGMDPPFSSCPFSFPSLSYPSLPSPHFL